MANDINLVTLIGRLTQAPELKQVPSGTSVVKFSIANNKKYSVNNETREEVSFFNCVAWGKLADVINQYCQKGKQVAIEGRLGQNRWQDQQGQNRSAVEIVVEKLQFLDSGQAGKQEVKSNTAQIGQASSVTEQPELLDECPF